MRVAPFVLDCTRPVDERAAFKSPRESAKLCNLEDTDALRHALENLKSANKDVAAPCKGISRAPRRLLLLEIHVRAGITSVYTCHATAFRRDFLVFSLLSVLIVLIAISQVYYCDEQISLLYARGMNIQDYVDNCHGPLTIRQQTANWIARIYARIGENAHATTAT